MNRLIIGIGHRRRRGKDLFGEYLYQKLSSLYISVRRDWFAASLKRMCQGVFSLTGAQLWGDQKTEVDTYWNMTPRAILQLAGTEAMRGTFGGDIWAKTLERRALDDPLAWVIVCDVRFPEEVQCIKRLGGILIRIDRPQPATDEDAHRSETALANYTGWDYIFDNTGSIEELKTMAVNFIDKLR